MAQQVKRAFKYRFYPTDGQAAELSRTFGCVRLAWNRTLAERRRLYHAEGRSLSYAASDAAHAHFLPRQAEFLGQAHGLTASMLEKLCRVRHGDHQQMIDIN